MNLTVLEILLAVAAVLAALAVGLMCLLGIVIWVAGWRRRR